jgi:hypothetical protein
MNASNGKKERTLGTTVSTVGSQDTTTKTAQKRNITTWASTRNSL